MLGLLALSALGCLDLELPGDDEGGDGVDVVLCEEDCTHELSGELILFVNARLSDESSSFQSHIELATEGTFLGNELFLYDPTKVCEDGGNACRLTSLGYLHLDDALGDISVEDGSLRKFVVRDLAWHPEQGLWAATFDTLNDEWSITHLEVDDWSRRDNLIGVERWVVPPGPAESPSTDPCYWFEAVSGLGFAGDELLLGVRGTGSKGLVSEGSLLRVRTEVFDQGHCVQDSDVSQDPLYYACDVVCEQWCSFGNKIGVAGDVVEALDGESAAAWLRSEDEDAMALDHNELSTCAPPAAGEVSEAASANVFLDEVVRGDEIDAMARIDGALYGLSVLGKVYLIDEVERTVDEVDDLSGLFADQGLRLRGAAAVTVP
ncbi:hypothetical protein G6O69_36260 [Pseudenhygromyxa sp. WMMC2535]|uniref:hypothetical protein n=1 Tax=Pseudenhygromyxa sp. WMMC2535 TaxID=2712867 RepID=UPI0015558A29|nr:hypothetical protein [Pseudenhygromyxa sp. WMMC2535]NVB43336.1 hypothetical protein [Pseudenhygromyxa sp. WMMC2535]